MTTNWPERAAMIAPVLIRLAVAVLLAAPTPLASQRSGGSTISPERVLSPTVVASSIAHVDETQGPMLDLLVLWRGSPGWFMRGGGGGSSGGGSGAGVVNVRIRYGPIDLGLTFDAPAGVAEVGGRRIPLGDANVLLFDNVDQPAGPQLAGLLRVEPAIPDGPRRIEMVLRRSPQLLEYLRCGVDLPDPTSRDMMELVCAQMLGTCDVRLASPALQKMLDASCTC